MKIFHYLSLGLLILSMFDVRAQDQPRYQTARDGRIFKVFQFSPDQLPRIDGQTDDWSLVPEDYRYGTNELMDTEDGIGTQIDPDDLKVEVTVGWVKGFNRIYFLYKAYDNFWDFGRFNPQGYLNDIFELVVDGNLSGGPFIFNPIYPKEELQWDGKNEAYLENHFTFSGVHAQNYHMFTPPVNQAWTLIWGSQPWISQFPYANVAYQYDFKPGESGHLIMEGWITAFDHAPHDGPEHAVESRFLENKVIGLSWSILDFDGGAREGHMNLSHNVNMVKDASFLCAFRLMPKELSDREALKADWTYKVIDMDQRMVAFRDESSGVINKWIWDFGDGEYSFDQHPIHRFQDKGVHKVITLTVEGPDGESKRTRYWEVMIR